MSDITYKIRWLLKTANPEPLTLVLEEEEIAELASQWDTTVKGDGSMAFEGVRIVSKTNYNLNNLGGDVKNKSVQKLTPGQALDWAKGISHQSLKKYIVEDEEMGPYTATTDGNGVECRLEYTTLKSTGNGYELYINGELRCKLNYAEMWHVRAALTILESEYQHLAHTDIYKLGDKI